MCFFGVSNMWLVFSKNKIMLLIMKNVEVVKISIVLIFWKVLIRSWLR